MSDRIDVAFDGEVRQQRQCGAGRQSLLDRIERVLVVERRGNEDDVALGRGASMCQDSAAPVLAIVREEDALGPSRRARGVALDRN